MTISAGPRLMHILTVFGTRPEAIKMAPVIDALKADGRFRVTVCVTGQHREMIAPILDFFGIAVDHDCALMRPGQDLNGLFSRTMVAVGSLLGEIRPDRVLVHGDTTTAAAAALAAFHLAIPVGHVEAGLRTYRFDQPWPEEMNRRIVDLAADLLFAPTEASRRNLESEANGEGKTIHVTGNTVIDALLAVVGRLEADPALRARINATLPQLDPGKRLVLVTGHRRENFGEPFRQVCLAMRDLAERGDIEIVYPVHLNPRVREAVFGVLGETANVRLVEPLDYLSFVAMMSRAAVILSDSGGVQEEAPSLGKPVVVMRNVTERPEAVAAGTVHLAGTDRAQIVALVSGFLDDPARIATAACAINPYGDGRAAARIVKALAEALPHKSEAA